MRKWIAAVVVCLSLGAAASPAVSACGDKFMLSGRGVRFQQAYAAIHPAAILLVVPPKSVKQAAVRDSRLRDALKMAGHRVDVVQSAKLADALGRSRYDIILAGRGDAMSIPDSLLAGPRKPSVIGVLEDAAVRDLAAAQQKLDAVLKAPQPLPDILRLLDDVMKARLERSRAASH